MKLKGSDSNFIMLKISSQNLSFYASYFGILFWQFLHIILKDISVKVMKDCCLSILLVIQDVGCL